MIRTWNWTLILAGAAMILLEVALGGFAGFDLVLIGAALALGGATGLYTGSLYAGSFVAGVLGAAWILVGRRAVRRHVTPASAHASNADAVVGRRGLVVAPIAPHRPGRVRVGDEEWRAMAAEGAAGSFVEGAEITVSGVDGVTLLVR